MQLHVGRLSLVSAVYIVQAKWSFPIACMPQNGLIPGHRPDTWGLSGTAAFLRHTQPISRFRQLDLQTESTLTTPTHEVTVTSLAELYLS